MTLVDTITSAAINGLLIAAIAFAGLVAAILIRFIIAWVQDENDVNDAARISGRWTGLVLGGAATAGATGLVQFGDIIGMFTMFIGQHPFAVSNVGIAGVGAAIITGLAALTVEQYIGISLALMGGTFVLAEVYG